MEYEVYAYNIQDWLDQTDITHESKEIGIYTSNLTGIKVLKLT